MKIELMPGEVLYVGLHESDGLFTIFHDHPKHEGAVVVEAEMPDTAMRQGVIYREDFGVTTASYGGIDKSFHAEASVREMFQHVGIEVARRMLGALEALKMLDPDRPGQQAAIDRLVQEDDRFGRFIRDYLQGDSR